MRQLLTVWLGSVGLSLFASACIVHAPPEPMPIVSPSYGYAPAESQTVGEPSPYEVSSMPPEPLYEQMSASPGYGYVWIDGYWHWNGYEWVWVSGRWEHEQDGYAYVAPYYAYNDGAYVYTPGYWRSQRNLPSGWSVASRGDGRPPIVRPPVGWHPAQPVSGGHGVPTYEGGPRHNPVILVDPHAEPTPSPASRPIYNNEPESRFPPQAPRPDPEPYVPSHPAEAPTQRAPEPGRGATQPQPGPVFLPRPEAPRPEAPHQEAPHPEAPHPGPAPAHGGEHAGAHPTK